MAFNDLSNVTTALMDLLRMNINNYLQSGGPTVSVVPAAPNRIPSGSQNHLSVYLYHVSEDPYYKNAIGAGNDVPNVSRAPMSLCLYYIVSAYHQNEDIDNDALTAQNIMGMALKTLHDYPVITDETNVLSNPVLPPSLRDRQNSVQVIMRQISPEDAVGFWTSEDQQMTILSAYYEVRVVFLEPERPVSTPGIVLSVGTYLQQLSAPYLSGSRSSLRFSIPAIAGGAVHSTETSPARAILDDRVAPPPENRRLTLEGVNLNQGRSRALVLRNSRWQNQATPIDEAFVDLSLNPNWSTVFRSDRVEVSFQSTLDVQTSGGPVTLTLAPGIYAAQARIVTRQEVTLGQLKDIVSTSNETAFAIAGRIESHDPPDGAGNITVTVGSEIDLTTLSAPPDHITVSLAGIVYGASPVDPPANAGEFSISGPTTITLRPAANIDLTPPQPQAHAFRLIINGAESAPFWIELS